MKPSESRRNFLKKATLTGATLGVLPRAFASLRGKEESLFKISLAQWSLNPLLFSGELDHLDFPKVARELNIEAVEYVNQFFMDKAEDMAYLKEMKTRADGEGVTSVLIMCDNEGMLGNPELSVRMEAVERHKKWVQAAKYLGCHAIRVNGFSTGGWGSAPGDYDEEMKLVADGLRRLAEYAAPSEISVIIENHGGHSSNGAWLAGVMKMADHPGVGTLPDFGNFRISKERTYDSYQGVEELMPFAKGVSVKPHVYDHEGGEHDLDYARMMRIVLQAGYHGYCGIEHGPKGAEKEGIARVRDALLETRNYFEFGN